MKLNEIYFKCEKCKESFLLNVNNIMSRKPVTIDNDVYFVTFVKCFNCGKKHAVQIDNKETLDLLMEYEKLFVRLSMLRKKGKNISKKDNEKLKEINNEIKVIRPDHRQLGAVVQQRLRRRLCEIFSSSGGNHERTGDQRQAAAFLREELRYRKAVRSKRPYIRCLCKLPRERRKIRALKESRVVEDQLS